MKLIIINFIVKHYIKILAFILSIFLGSLIFWGLGNLVIYAFDINYKWTLLDGFVTELIVILLENILTPSKK